MRRALKFVHREGLLLASVAIQAGGRPSELIREQR